MSESLQPSRKLSPTDRDFEIYEAVHLTGQRREDVRVTVGLHRIQESGAGRQRRPDRGGGLRERCAVVHVGAPGGLGRQHRGQDPLGNQHTRS